ncbi:hypothetical protein DPMN_011935 [Dreissena polymorpha]|uniref:Uncharacterized protein n=1 Tax=Dreissena polymorpha TaxID=45954 RepID=A0A9D4N1G7_DREPO|nr:hypothetical protein DPMN_011935 [Dreissena polymorpha]
MRSKQKQAKSRKICGGPSEPIKQREEETTDATTTTCLEIWKENKWSKTWIQFLVISKPKTANLKLCKNYSNINLI